MSSSSYATHVSRSDIPSPWSPIPGLDADMSIDHQQNIQAISNMLSNFGAVPDVSEFTANPEPIEANDPAMQPIIKKPTSSSDYRDVQTQLSSQEESSDWLARAGLGFLSEIPQEPLRHIGFDTDIGLLVTKFHAIEEFDTCIQLVYDMRYNGGSYFRLKESDKPVKVLLNNVEYNVIIPDLVVNIGSINVQFLFKEQ